MATAYLPGTPLAFSGLPSFALSSQKVSYAISRASNPPDILPFLMQASNPAAQATWTWGSHRGTVCIALLDSFMEVAKGLTRGGLLIPIQECASMVLEAAKVRMETEAGSIVVGRLDAQLKREHPVPSWLSTIRRASSVLREIGEQDGGEAGVTGGENILNGCSNLLGSMARMADLWYRSSSRADPTSQNGTGQQEPLVDILDMTPSTSFFPSDLPYDNPSSHPPSHTHTHQYMNTSDRWMAGEAESRHTGGDGQNSNSNYGFPPNSQQQPTTLDLLLGQMFNYNSIPGNMQGQGQTLPSLVASGIGGSGTGTEVGTRTGMGSINWDGSRSSGV
jgi:hypothetical protein